MGGMLSTQAENPSSESPVASMASPSNESLQPKKLRKPAVTILQEVLGKKIKLNSDLEKENNAILKEFLRTFIEEMKKKDEIFALLFQKFYFTGSYFCDLRISMPDEYDINLEMKLPLKPTDFEVLYQQQVPSYAKYKLKNTQSLENHRKFLNMFRDDYLIPEKVRCWMQSVIDKTLRDYKCPAKCKFVQRGASGPARTIILVKDKGRIDIDLVPAIQCSLREKPPGIDGRVYEKVKNNLACFLVPKPYQAAGQAPINEAEQSRLWRTHYPDAESRLIHDKGCVKPVIKLLKLLRNKEDWKIIASYYLKTVVMWMIIHNPDSGFWANDKLYDRFIDALRKLAEYVKKQNLPYLFSSKHNLIKKINDAQAYNISARIGVIIRDIEKDPQNLWKVFNVSPTFHL